MTIDEIYQRFHHYVAPNPFASINEVNSTILNLVCVKKKKTPNLHIGVSDYVVQYVVGDHWGTAYHTTPPHGTPPTLHSMEDCFIIAGLQALERWEAQQEIFKKELTTNN